MKKYCLTEQAKRELRELTRVILFIVNMIIALTLFLGLPALIAGLHTYNSYHEHVLAHVGIVSYTIALSIIVISLKRWLQHSIVKC